MMLDDFSCTVGDGTIELSESISVNASGDIFLANIMPQAEYMYGCTPTALAMLLGYYDLYGYGDADYSNLIEGTVSVNSRGSDGDIYNMNEFDSVLGSFIATEDHVYRFFWRNGVDTTPEQELQYTFVNGGVDSSQGLSVIDTSYWNCLSDYIGTSQFWRESENYSSWVYYGRLDEMVNPNLYDPITVEWNGVSRSFDWRYQSTLYGLLLYVESRGYSLDYDITRTERVDTLGGTFTFEDYMAEIDAGRAVLISIEEHSMVGYGYNKETREIIFDDTYFSDQRMAWGGAYYYSGAYRQILSMTVIGLTGGQDTESFVISTALTQGVSKDVNVVLKKTGSVTATPGYMDDAWAIRIGTDGQRVTLEGGSLRINTNYSGAGITFGGISNSLLFGLLDGTVRFTGDTVSINVGVKGSGYGILGKNLMLEFSGAGSEAQDIYIGVSGGLSIYGIYATGKLDSSGIFGGIVQVNGGGGNAAGIYAEEALKISISGIVYVSDEAHAVSISTLRNFEANKEYLVKGSEDYFAIWGGGGSSVSLSGNALILGRIFFDDTSTFSMSGNAAHYGTFEAWGNKTSLALSGNALMTGQIWLYDDTTIDISGNAAIKGEINFYNNTTLTISLRGRSGNSPVISANDSSLGLDGLSISVNPTGAASGVYLLVESPDIADITSITINGQTLFVGDYVDIADSRYRLDATNTQLRLTIGRPNDIEAPHLVGEPTARSTSNGVIFSWNPAVDSGGVAGYILMVNNDTYVVTGNSHTLQLLPGTYTYSIQAFDSGGNYSVWSSEHRIDVTDLIPPTQTGMPTVTINGLTVTFNWSEAIDQVGVAGYHLRINDQNYTSTTNSFTITLGIGEFSYALRAYDAAGNQSGWTETQYFTLETQVDTTAPVLAGQPKVQLEGGRATIHWDDATDDVGVAGYTVKVNGKTYQVTDNFLALNLDHGSYTYSIQAYDAAGNRSGWSAEKSFQINDTEAPVFFSLPKVNVAGKKSFVIQWKEARDNVRVAGYVVEVNGQLYDVGMDTFLRLDGQESGTYTYRVQAYDAAGNRCDWTSSRSFTLDDDCEANFFDFASAEIDGKETVTVANFSLAAGLYSIAGNFGLLDLKIAVIDLDNRNKVIGRATVKNGIVTSGKPMLLNGNYAVTVTGSSKGKSGEFTLELEGGVFHRGDNSDDVFTALGAAHTVAVGDTAQTLVAGEWVGYGDAVDYRKLSLDYAGKYTFDLSALDDKAKFSIYKVNPKNGKLQLIKSVSANAGKTGQVKNLLLDAGEYYFAVESPTAKKGGGTEYSVGINAGSTFFTRGNNGDDNFAALAAPYRVAVADTAKTISGGEWVGYGDAVDYRQVTFDYAGKYTFDLSALDDKAKLSIYRVNSKNGKLQLLKSVTANAGKTGQVKDLLLDAGEYYFAVESPTAKKGGGTEYSVEINSASTFFTKGDNSDDNYLNVARVDIDDKAYLVKNDWVGYGDAVDYTQIVSAGGRTYNFGLSGVTDTAKLTLYTEKDGKLKKLKTVTVKQGAGSIAGVALEAGESYWVAVESANAKKGGGTDYKLQVTLEVPSATPLSGWESGPVQLLRAQETDLTSAAAYTGVAAQGDLSALFDDKKMCGILA